MTGATLAVAPHPMTTPMTFPNAFGGTGRRGAWCDGAWCDGQAAAGQAIGLAPCLDSGPDLRADASLDTPLDPCLDTPHLPALLSACLPACRSGRQVVTQVDVLQVRRNSSRQRNPLRLTVLYAVHLSDVANRAEGAEAADVGIRATRHSGRRSTHNCYGQVFRGGGSAVAATGTAALHLPALDMLLWPWPADPGLPQLPRLLDPTQASTFWGEPATAVDVLRYEPACRATLRYTRAAGPGGVADPADTLYAKTFDDDRGAAVYHRFMHFWQAGLLDPLAPTVAEPLGYCPHTRALWQASARGVPLVTQLPKPGAVRADRVALALAAVHAAPPVLAGPLPRDTAHWVQEVARRARKIGRAQPALADRAARLAGRLALSAASLPAAAATLIHGDCHPEQLWLDEPAGPPQGRVPAWRDGPQAQGCTSEQRVVWFDFDEMTLGDPMEDLAQFVTKLQALPGGPALVPPLVGAYARLAPQHHCAQRLRWHRAVQQLLQASRAFVFQRPDWPTTLGHHLAQAESLVEAL